MGRKGGPLPRCAAYTVTCLLPFPAQSCLLLCLFKTTSVLVHRMPWLRGSGRVLGRGHGGSHACLQRCTKSHGMWSLQVRLCLVVNKIDRLILELQLQPQEAYERIKGIITQVNMIVSAFESESFMSEADAVLAHESIKANADAG